jgi:hypothetical protein
MGIFRRRDDGDGEDLPRHDRAGLRRRAARRPGRDGRNGASGPDERPDDDQPDETFEFLTVRQAARLRSLTRATLAEHGVESEIHADHLLAAGEWRFGLHNLFAICRHTPGGEKAWPAIVRTHVATVVRRSTEPSPADLPAGELLDHAFIRVCGAATMPSLAAFGYHRPLGGELLELIAYDTPDVVSYLTDTEVERVGAEKLRAAGVEHLLAEPFGEVHWLQAPGGARFTVLAGESVHTASRVLVVDDVLRRVLGDADTPNGLLVSVPNRHQLAFHRPEDGSFIRAIEGLARFTVDNYADGVGGISPHLFWRPPRGGMLQQLTEIEGPGHVAVRIDGEFAEIVQRLLGLPPTGPS